MAYDLEKLRKMTDEELVKEHDKIAGSHAMPPDYFLNELNRRQQNKMSNAMLKYTCWITIMTGVILLCTLFTLCKS